MHSWIKSRRPLYKLEIPQQYVRQDVCAKCGLFRRSLKQDWGYWRSYYAWKGQRFERKAMPPCKNPFACVQIEPDPLLRMADDGNCLAA